MTEFRKDQKEYIKHIITNCFLKDADCYSRIDNLTNENCFKFIEECNKHLYEISYQNKHISGLIDKYIETQSKYDCENANLSYDGILCNIYEANDWNYYSAINGFEFCMSAICKVQWLYTKYQRKLNEINKPEDISYYI
jgi:hypothetical protein